MNGYVPEKTQTNQGPYFGQSVPISQEEPERVFSPEEIEMIRKQNEEYRQWKGGELTEVPEFAFTIHAATRGMSDQDRTSYLQSFRDRMSERLQRYEWRKAKGVGLTKEQDAIYTELLTKLQALNQMMETPYVYTQYMEGAGASIGKELGIDYSSLAIGTGGDVVAPLKKLGDY